MTAEICFGDYPDKPPDICYTFPNVLLQQLLEITKESKEKNVEIGAELCNGGIIEKPLRLGGICHGGQCSIQIERTCWEMPAPGEIGFGSTAGDVHTHPKREESRLSGGDHVSALYYNWKKRQRREGLLCVIGTEQPSEDQIMTCKQVRKNIPPDDTHVSILLDMLREYHKLEAGSTEQFRMNSNIKRQTGRYFYEPEYVNLTQISVK